MANLYPLPRITPRGQNGYRVHGHFFWMNPQILYLLFSLFWWKNCLVQRLVMFYGTDFNSHWNEDKNEIWWLMLNIFFSFQASLAFVRVLNIWVFFCQQNLWLQKTRLRRRIWWLHNNNFRVYECKDVKWIFVRSLQFQIIMLPKGIISL